MHVSPALIQGNIVCCTHSLTYIVPSHIQVEAFTLSLTDIVIIGLRRIGIEVGVVITMQTHIQHPRLRYTLTVSTVTQLLQRTAVPFVLIEHVLRPVTMVNIPVHNEHSVHMTGG